MSAGESIKGANVQSGEIRCCADMNGRIADCTTGPVSLRYLWLVQLYRIKKGAYFAKISMFDVTLGILTETRNY
jgi:hypothetical protein